jgi:hypothetical protein
MREARLHRLKLNLKLNTVKHEGLSRRRLKTETSAGWRTQLASVVVANRCCYFAIEK